MSIAVVRIAGQVEQKTEVKETLKRLNLPRKYSCVIVDEKDAIKMGMVRAVKTSVAYGKVSDDFVKEIEKKRGKEGKKFFSLHPPIGGLKRSSKVAAPKGILGENKEISKLIERML
jgi:ribosomal protein L30/L7E